MRDHSQCEVTAFQRDGKDWERHECGPCPHGRIWGGEFILYADGPYANTLSRERKLREIDGFRCEDDHPQLLDMSV